MVSEELAISLVDILGRECRKPERPATTTQGVEKIVSDKLALDLTSKMIDFCIVFRD